MRLLRRLFAPLVGGTDRRVIVLALARMVGALGNSFLIVVLPLYIASGDVDLVGIVGSDLGVGSLAFALTEPVLIGLVLSLFGFVNSLAQPFAGRLSDRVARRKLFILVGIGVLGSASGAYAFVESYWVVLGLRALQGLGIGIAVPATVALVNEYSTGGDRGGSFGVFNTFRLLGFGFGPLLAGAIVQFGPYALPGGGTLSGFDAAFAVAFLGAASSFALVSVFVADADVEGADAPDRTGAAGDEADADAETDDDGLPISVTGEKQLLDPILVLGLATVFLAITIALFATLQAQINARLGQGSFLFSAQFGAVVIANVTFQIPVGRLSDTYGRKPFLVGGFLLLIPSVFAQGVVTSPALMLVARLLQGVSVAAVFAPSLALAGDLAGEGRSGSTLSVLTMGFGIGVAIGPLASGYLVGFGFVWPFAVGAVLAVLGLVLVVTQVEDTVSARMPGGKPAPQD
jgi:MFS family permease